MSLKYELIFFGVMVLALFCIITPRRIENNEMKDDFNENYTNEDGRYHYKIVSSNKCKSITSSKETESNVSGT